MKSVEPNFRILPTLKFELPKFLRMAWANPRAQAVWEPRLQLIVDRLNRLEDISVLAGLRDCFEKEVSIKLLRSYGAFWRNLGMNFHVLREEKNGNYSCVIGRQKGVISYLDAWQEKDHYSMGILSGFPSCCSHFFFRELRKTIDPIWSIANSTNVDCNDIIVKDFYPQNNVLLRQIGLTALFHLPCSLQCAYSKKAGDEIVGLHNTVWESDEEINWLHRILEWPTHWSELHGIAEVKNPIFKFTYNSVPTARKFSVTLHSKSYPLEGAKGISFPFQRVSRKVPTSSSVSVGLDEDYSKFSWYSGDNGFVSNEAMYSNHQKLILPFNDFLASSSGNMLDMGCGNGLLLARISKINPLLIPFGIDTLSERIRHAQTLNPSFKSHFVACNLLDVTRTDLVKLKFSLIIVMIGRLFESGRTHADECISFLRSNCEYVLFYGYSDSMKQYGNLGKAIQALGITVQIVKSVDHAILCKLSK